MPQQPLLSWHKADPLPALGSLAGGMAHDFNNLLAGLILNLEYLEGLVPSTGEAGEVIEQCLDAATQGTDMTRQLLAVAGCLPLEPQQLDLNPLVAKLAERRRGDLPETIAVAVDLAPEIWPVMADPAQMEASLVALVDNALAAMPRGGTLAFATARQVRNGTGPATGEFSVIEIRDTGCGIAPERLANVFEPFYTTRGRGAGRGLGLATVQGFVAQSGGCIEIASEPGLGTSVRLYLPRASDR